MKIRLFGDSIFRGYAVVPRPDRVGEDEARSIPLWPLRSPASVINLVLGEEAANFSGRLRLPTVKESVREVDAALASADIGPEDVLVMLDVGQHSGDPDAYVDAWTRLRRVATETRPLRLLVCEGFDNGARGQASHQYDRPFGDRTINDALRAAALELHPEWVGRTELVPVSEPMAAYHQWLRSELGARAYLRDGIHLSVWGQFRLCGLLLRAALPDRSPDLGRLFQALAPLEPHLDLQGTALRSAVEMAFSPELLPQR